MLTQIGWREWLALPELGVPAIKAKMDTGARTSALHVANLEPFVDNDQRKVRFVLHPLRRNRRIELVCVADVVDARVVSDSGGHREKRLVIVTPVRLGDRQWPIEITLTNREEMLFRMLLGRTAMANRFTVNPAKSFCEGRELGRAYRLRRRSTDRIGPRSNDSRR
jgi:hypothetical protein